MSLRVVVSTLFSGLFALSALTLSVSAAAQDNDEGFDQDPDDVIASKEHLDQEKGDLMPGEKPKKTDEAAPEDPTAHDPKEEPGTAYTFVGLRVRDIVVPKFMMGLFADGGSTVNVFSIGPEASYRKDKTEFDLALTYADYSFGPMLFKGSGDNEFSWEEVSSSLKTLYVTLDLLYDIPVVDDSGRFSVLVGGGVGIGVVFGSLYRYQVQPNVGYTALDPENSSSWRYCETPNTGVPNYCDNKNSHYKTQGYEESSWINGGSKPNFMPWISLPQVSFRYKPIKEVQTRFDTGFSLTGFFFGGSAGYGF